MFRFGRISGTVYNIIYICIQSYRDGMIERNDHPRDGCMQCTRDYGLNNDERGYIDLIEPGCVCTRK